MADTLGQSQRAVLDDGLLARMGSVAHRLRRYVLIEGFAWVLAFLLCGALVQVALDYASRGMRWSMRAALLGVIVAWALRLLIRRVVEPFRKKIGVSDVANLVERRYPQLSSSLISAVRFSSGEVGRQETNSALLVDRVIQEADQRAAGLEFGAVLNPSRAKRAIAVICAVLAFGAAATALKPEITGLWFARHVLLQEVAWPRRTRLVLDMEGRELIAAIGDDVSIEARAQGVQPRSVEFFFETSSGRRGRETMATVGSAGSYRYRFTLKNAQEDITFYLVGGDDRTEAYVLRLLERPRVVATALRIVPPSYTGLTPVDLGDGHRAAQVLEGSTVTISATTNQPVVGATLLSGREVVVPVFGDDSTLPAPGDTRDSTTTLTATVQPAETVVYEFGLVDANGLENRKPVRFSIRVMEDEAPRVRIKLEGVGEMVTADAVLPLVVEATDAYGLSEVSLRYQLSREDAASTMIPLETFSPRLTKFSHELSWPVSAAAPVPGERLVLVARATDFDDVNGPNETETPETSLRIVTRDELLAELARREEEYRLDFERLVAAQEKLRGELLTVLSRADRTKAGALAAALAPLERRQRSIAGSTNVVRQQFARILAELRVNQLVSHVVEERLGRRIVEPLTQLARRDLVMAADTVRRWSLDGSPETASLVDPQQATILAQMREVLANMIQWEGYQEAVNTLRDILRLQAELEAETQRAIEDQAGDIFDE